MMRVEEQVESYISFKRGLGVAMVSDASALRQLERFAAAEGHAGPIDVGLALRWARSGEHARSYEAKRYELARRVCDYCAALGADVPRLPPGLMGRLEGRVEPYIYTDEEVSLLMRAASRMYDPEGRMRPLAYEVAVGLMRSTGMRPSEVLSLEDGDVDLGAGEIAVRRAKNGRERLVPLGPGAAGAIESYVRKRDSLRTGRKCPRLVVVGDSPVSVASLEHAFVELRCVLLGRGEVWERRPPRAYDLRHTFAVRTLLRWRSEGADVNAMLPVLATYMGHADISETYWYLTGCPELMSVASSAFEALARGPRRW